MKFFVHVRTSHITMLFLSYEKLVLVPPNALNMFSPSTHVNSVEKAVAAIRWASTTIMATTTTTKIILLVIALLVGGGMRGG